MLAVTLQGFGTEAPREALIAVVIGLGLWLFGLYVGAALTRRHVVRPAEERHEEVMAAHRAHAEHNGYDLPG